MSSGARKIK